MYARSHPVVAALLLVGGATIVGKTLLSQVAPTNQVMLYLLAVVISGLWWGHGAALLASVCGVLAFDLFFVPPLYSLSVSDAEYIITFVALLIVALAIGNLTGRLRERERETAALYAFSQRMATAGDLAEVARAVAEHISNQFDLQAHLEIPGVAPAGSPLEESLRFPLRTPQGEVGSLTVAGGKAITAAQRRMLEAMAAQVVMAVERAQLAEAARRAEVLAEAEKLHDALLHSISHALRTPLSAIIGCLSTLLDPGQTGLDPATRKDLAETAREEAERLNGLVGNLLDMTRLEAGHLRLLVDWYDLADVIGAALGQAERSLQGRSVRVKLPDGLPLIPLDQALIVQVLENLLSNAAHYSPTGTPIEIRAQADGKEAMVSVADRGPGIPEAERERVFERFYRGDRPGSLHGTGLGLAICKGIVEAHHGRIWVEAREGGGAVFAFALPLTSGRERDGQGPDRR